ncbi:MAG TPA: glycosyltransferase family 87 protein [Terracidiphilus sp.]|nr:glycosyltransferase family 87 protein [Terracidiphilus sp.]
MNNARRDAVYLLILGSAIFLLLGIALERAAPVSTVDFRVVYFSTRCLLSHCDPYQEAQLLHIYETQGGETPQDSPKIRKIETRFNYPPTVFLVTVPVALLPFGAAQFVWLALIAGGFITASFLAWDLAATHAPLVAGALIAFFLANSQLLLITGNAAAIVISLSVVAVWCFLRNRHVALGILCLAVALAVKPHDAAFVWLFFLLAGGVHRRRALQTLGVVILLSIPVLLWVASVAPHAMSELSGNLHGYAVLGGINDPGPASMAAHGLDMMINLQTFLSAVRDEPGFYNPVTYIVCAALLLIWSVVTLRTRMTLSKTWLALAVVAPLTMLPVYHRQCDAGLLLLTVPACAMLWARGGAAGRLALLVNSIGFLLVGDIPWAVFLALLNHLRLPASHFSSQVLLFAQVAPVPLILLVMSAFYLLIYARAASGHDPVADASGS